MSKYETVIDMDEVCILFRYFMYAAGTHPHEPARVSEYNEIIINDRIDFVLASAEDDLASTPQKKSPRKVDNIVRPFNL